jgi:hypothetical protein
MKGLRPTPVFDTYWRFAFERQEVFFRRLAGSRPPWTSDPILSTYRFTNVYRASDRVSQYLIRHVIYEGDQREEEVLFRTLLFKLFNKIETWEALVRALGQVSWKTFSPKKYAAVLDKAFARGAKIYSGAYIMPSPDFGAARKHRNHLLLVQQMMKDRLVQGVMVAGSLRDVFTLLKEYKSIGAFLAYQFAIDLNYSPILNFSEMDFVVAGPGAQSGIRKAFAGSNGMSDEDIIRATAESAEREFEKRGLAFRSLYGRPLQLIDCQNLFCEVDKYSRVAHPEIAGTGRQRIKQRYVASSRPVPQWYPPKWRLAVRNAQT